jgi:hypothetical protein
VSSREARPLSAAATLRGLFDALQLIREQEQTALAEMYAGDVTMLEHRFRHSVRQCAERPPTTEPFYSQRRKPLAEPPPPYDTISTTHEFASHAARLAALEVADEPRLNMSYVDYEIFPSRTTEEGRIPRRSMDLLLANVGDGAPVATELKIRRDKNAFYALVQGLALAAELTSPTQRERLRSLYESLSVPTVGPFIDVCVIAFRAHEGTYLERLLGASESIAKSLMQIPVVANHVRRIVYLSAAPTESLSLNTTFVAGEGF